MSLERRLRVLLVPSAYYPHVGGIEEVTRQLAAHLRARGHEATILTNRWPAGVAAEEILDGLQVRRLRMELPGAGVRPLARFAAFAPGAAASLLRLVREARPHVVHLIGAGPNAAYFAALRPLVRAPLVLTAQGEFCADADRAFERSLSLRAGLRRLLSRAAAVTACSRFVLDELEQAMPLRAPSEVIPNGVDPSEFEPRRGERHPAGLGRYVFAAGRLVEQKGLDVLLQAFAAARGELEGRRLVIAGDGPERSRLTRLAERLGLDGDVSFLGSVERTRLAELMRGADVFAFPSRYEAFGVALLEAMAAGTPAVAARVGGVPELASDCESALLVPPDDAAALAAALVRLAREPELRARLAEGGRAQAARLSWERVVPRYEAIYRRVLRD